MYTRIHIENEVNSKLDIITKTVSFIEQCVQFWNKEGAEIYCNNLIGKIGTKETNALATETKYDSWLLDMILCDIMTKVRKYPGLFKAGRTSSHVFLHSLEKDEERILMLYTK